MHYRGQSPVFATFSTQEKSPQGGGLVVSDRRLSVLGREHDREDAGRFLRVGRVFGAELAAFVEIDPMKRTGHESWPAEWSPR